VKRRTISKYATVILGVAALLVSSSAPPALAQNGNGNGDGTGAELSARDRVFLTFAMFSNAQEIRMAQIALAQAVTPEVRAYAAMIIADHTAAQEQLARLAVQSNVEFPFGLTQFPDNPPTGQGTDIQFDITYLRSQIAGHRNAIAQFSREATSGTDPQLVAYARANLPVLQEHLQEAVRLLRVVQQRARSGAAG
jgi:putative membrane protein